MFGDWITAGSAMQEQFVSAAPFPLVVIDGFLDNDVAHQLVAEFPDVHVMPRSRDYVFGSKHELSSLEEAGPTCLSLYRELTGAEFALFLSELTGWDLFVDPRFHGGGFHQGTDGGFLDMHVDFNIHPLHLDWLRRLNILLYLNPGWREEWGGSLHVKAHPNETAKEIAPLFNRAVIMQTGESTYHGYPKMSLPPGVTRRSIAAYAYERVTAGAIAPRTTGWVPEGAGMAKQVLARNYNTLVSVKNRLFGSGTAANR